MLAHDEHNPQSDWLEPESWKGAKKSESTLNAYWFKINPKTEMANPNVDVDYVSKYVSVNELFIARVNGLFWENITGCG
jgi:hypothetical protein